MRRVKEIINGGLRRVTGYQLQRASGAAPAPTRKRPAKKAPVRKKPRSRTAPIRKKVAVGGPRGSPPAFRARQGWDDEAIAIVTRVAERTMTSPEKVHALVEAVRHVVRHDVPGDIVECGVWRGGSMQAVALTLMEQGDTGRELHLYDTFEGMPPPTRQDVRPDGTTAAELLATHARDHRLWAVAGLDDVTDGMDEVGYPPERVHYHRGLVQDTIPGQAPERIALLRLHTDWYESTRHELAHLCERLSPGGVLIIDGYGDWQGARRATEEFLARSGEPILLVPLGSARIGVKPG